jgi:low affinity Fe/Cu permease
MSLFASSRSGWLNRIVTAGRCSLFAVHRPAPTFIAAVAVVLIWAITGPLFDYLDTWQLVINTGTTIVPFLMVIQNSQNRDGAAR